MGSNPIRGTKGGIVVSYNDEQLKQYCAESFSYAEVLRKADLTPSGGNYELLKKNIKRLEIDISHFTGKGWSKGKTAQTDERVARIVSKNERDASTIFVEHSTATTKVAREHLKRHNLIPYVCDNCGCDGNWMGGIIALELDHKNGINDDHRLENLHWLCPNCHALTSTYRGKNKGK